MHFEIKSALQHGKQLTPRQRASGFSEAPVVAGQILRRGTLVKMTPEQLEKPVNRNVLTRLLQSESVLVELVDGEDRLLLTSLPVNEKALDAPGSPDGDEGTFASGGDNGAGKDVGEVGQMGADAPTTPKPIQEPMTEPEALKFSLPLTVNPPAPMEESVSQAPVVEKPKKNRKGNG